MTKAIITWLIQTFMQRNINPSTLFFCSTKTYKTNNIVLLGETLLMFINFLPVKSHFGGFLCVKSGYFCFF